MNKKENEMNYANKLKAGELLDSCYNEELKAYLIPEVIKNEILGLMGQSDIITTENIKFFEAGSDVAMTTEDMNIIVPIKTDEKINE